VTTPAICFLGEDQLDLVIKQTIIHAASNAPRSLQTAIGPSEVGQPCLRRLAYKHLDVAPASTSGDIWRPTVGTAAHAWLADSLELANRELGHQRWIVEERVDIAPGLSGSCDAFDTQTRTVVDWKVVGPSSLKKYRKDGPGQQYRTQLHLYGKGHANAGRQVDHVAIMFLPSAGALSDAYWWTEPYDQQIADDAIERLTLLGLAVDVSLAQGHPLHQVLEGITATPAHSCVFCPWFSHGSTDLAAGCPGVDPDPTRPGLVDLTTATL
jgi:hypothetical protein